MLQVHTKSQQAQAGQEDGRKNAPGRRIKKCQNGVQDQGSCQKYAPWVGAVRVLVSILPVKFPGPSYRSAASVRQTE